MKKFYTYAMILAAAAMALTACSKNEIRPEERTSVSKVLNITATTAQTKSVFGDKDASKYPTKWTVNKDVLFSADENELIAATPSLVGEGASATFSPEFPTLGESGTIYAFSPKGNFESIPKVGGFTSLNTTYHDVYLIVPSAQKPLANSVDESAMAIAASAAYTSESTSLIMAFNHILAYGKMTITNFAGTISSVELQFPENIAGDGLYYYYTSGNLSNATVNSITLDPTNVVGNVFWFALAPTAGTTGKMKIIITDDQDDTYTKTIDLTSKALPFIKGQVSAFTANFSGIEKDEGLDVSGTYNKISTMGDLESGDYIIVGEKTTSSFGILTYGAPDGSNRLAYTQAYTSEGAIPASITDPETNQVWTLAVDGSNVTLYSKLGEEYLKANGGLSFGATGTTFTASAESNMFEFKASTTYLGVNKSGNYWRDYASSTLTQTNGLVLFKKVDTRTKLATPEAIVVDNEVAWDAVSNAASYNIKIGGKIKEGVTGTSYVFDNEDFSLETGYYSVSVVAVPSNTELYKDSNAGEASGKVKVGTPKLETPELVQGAVTKNSINVTWDPDVKATEGYYCSISPADVEAQTVNTGSVTFTGLNANTNYTITVYAKAVGGSEPWVQSESDDIAIKTLDEGVSGFTGTIARWSSASSFEITSNAAASNGSTDMCGTNATICGKNSSGTIQTLTNQDNGTAPNTWSVLYFNVAQNSYWDIAMTTTEKLATGTIVKISYRATANSKGITAWTPKFNYGEGEDVAMGSNATIDVNGSPANVEAMTLVERQISLTKDIAAGTTIHIKVIASGSGSTKNSRITNITVSAE